MSCTLCVVCICVTNLHGTPVMQYIQLPVCLMVHRGLGFDISYRRVLVHDSKVPLVLSCPVLTCVHSLNTLAVKADSCSTRSWAFRAGESSEGSREAAAVCRSLCDGDTLGEGTGWLDLLLWSPALL